MPGLIALIMLLAVVLVPAHLWGEIMAIFAFGQGLDARGLGWIMTRLFLEGVAGLPLLLAAGFLALGQEQRGIMVGFAGLLLSLTIVNVLVFYFDQFQAIIDTMIQFMLLLGAIHYRQRYLVA